MFLELLSGSILAAMLTMKIITVAVHARSPRLPHIALLAASHFMSYFALMWLLVTDSLPTGEGRYTVLAVLVIGSMLAIWGNYVVVNYRGRNSGER